MAETKQLTSEILDLLYSIEESADNIAPLGIDADDDCDRLDRDVQKKLAIYNANY